MKIILSLLLGAGLSSALTAQESAQDSAPAQTQPASQPPPPPYQRPVSPGQLFPNILTDQSKIWLFPMKLNQKKAWIPAAVILGTTAALIVLDSHDAPYFRASSTYAGFNGAFTGNATAIGTVIVPVSLYAAGLLSKDKKMQGTALLAGEAVADSEILAVVLKDAFRRARPASLSPGENFSDTWFESGSLLRDNGGALRPYHCRLFSRYDSGSALPESSMGSVCDLRDGRPRRLFTRQLVGALYFRCVRRSDTWLFGQPVRSAATIAKAPQSRAVAVVIHVSGRFGGRPGTEFDRILRGRGRGLRRLAWLDGMRESTRRGRQ